MPPAGTRGYFVRQAKNTQESQEICRERRRRRMQIRRTRSTVSGELPSPPSSPETTIKSIPPSSRHPGLATSLQITVDNHMPNWGCVSLQGSSETMEDMWFVKEDLCRPEILGGKPIHFFAVIDGHGGTRVAELCKNMIHSITTEELMRVAITNPIGGGDVASCGLQQQQQRKEELDDQNRWKYLLRVALCRSFHRMNELAIETCSCDGSRNTCTSGCPPEKLDCAGAAAALALVAPGHIVVANCGDSRAVLSCGGRQMPLSQDSFKPESSEERERILASREDRFLKKFITFQPEPEITITERSGEDECLILATNGLWDVVPNEMACNIARTCLKDQSSIIKEDEDEILMLPSTCHLAAATLTRLALGRGSKHNITVIVSDLMTRPHAPHESHAN